MEVERNNLTDFTEGAAEMARQYDAAESSEGFAFVKATLDHLDVPDDEYLRVLDLGGGAGHYASRIVEVFQKAHVTVVDYSLAMLEEGKKRFSSDRIDWIQDDMTQLNKVPFGMTFHCFNFYASLHYVDAIPRLGRGNFHYLLMNLILKLQR